MLFDSLMHLILDNVGARLLLRDGALLPPRCGVCNRPVDSPPRRLRLSCTALASGSGHVTIYLHLCRWHAARRLLVIALSAASVAACIPFVNRRGKTVNVFPFMAFIASALILLSCLFNNPFFRGLYFQNGYLEIKGFGKRFRESLREDEVRIINESEFKAMRQSANQQ